MSGRNWTPYELEIILHHAHSLGLFDRASAPIYAPTLQDLIERGLLKREPISSEIIQPTEKGRVFVEMLLHTPEPRNIWQDPRDHKEIIPERQSVDLANGVKLTAAPGWTIE